MDKHFDFQYFDFVLRREVVLALLASTAVSARPDVVAIIGEAAEIFEYIKHGHQLKAPVQQDK